jgi:hypothetical protein
VHAFGVLDLSEHKISFTECERMNLPAMIASQLLLVERCSGQGQLSGLLEEVVVVFAGFFGLLLRVLDHSWRVKIQRR